MTYLARRLGERGENMMTLDDITGVNWDGQKCPTCFQGTLEQRVKRTQFEYRGHTLEYDQEGAWCGTYGEGIVTGKEAATSESMLDEFIARVDKEEAAELARIRKKRRQ